MDGGLSAMSLRTECSHGDDGKARSWRRCDGLGVATDALS